MKIFNTESFDATAEPMFFGRPVNVARADKQKYPIFERLREKQLSFFWRPEEISLTKDQRDFHQELLPHEQFIFVSNLKYQTLLDSVQGRGPGMTLKPSTSLPEMENWIEVWQFFENGIHAYSYTYILRNIFADPSKILDEIVLTPAIKRRAEVVSIYFDKVYQDVMEQRKDLVAMDNLYLLLIAINILEGLQFYVSFACSFAFAERSLMEGNAKVIKLIARDEQIHLSSTQHMINILKSGQEGEAWAFVAKRCEPKVYQMYDNAVALEKDWAAYLFSQGAMLGLNADILATYVDYLATQRLKAIGLQYPSPVTSNPLPWMTAWLNSDNVQTAPQETEIESYMVGQVNSDIDLSAFDEDEE